MQSSILRGVLLPLIFFTTIQLIASQPVKDLYGVFYKDINFYKKWEQNDRSNTFKDIFIDLYNLPARTRKYRYQVKVNVLDSFSENKENTAYSYLEFKKRTSVNFVIWGVESGSVKINGVHKGNIEIDKDTGFALMKGAFEKGVYFISLTINKKFKGVPVIVLSDRKVNTAKRGFNRKASSNARIYNIKARYPDVEVADLYNGFCFPYAEKNNREMFYKLSLKKDSYDKNKDSLFYKLFQFTINEKSSVELLKMTGFSKEQLNWWKNRIFKKEVCSYE